MEENKNQTIVDRIWRLFSSVTLAVVLFTFIAMTSIIGTLIEQSAPPENNLKLIGKLFGDSMAPKLYTLFDKLGFMDMYHSHWFVSLLLLFAANLIICSIDRLPVILRLVREKIRPLSDEQFKSAGIKKEFALKEKIEKAKETIGCSLRNAGFRFLESKEPNGCQLYAESGKWSRLGVYITHFSILFILLGALVGIMFGFKGFLNLPEGRTFSAVFTKNLAMSPAEELEVDNILKTMEESGGSITETARRLGLDQNAMKIKMEKYGLKPLGFEIRCDNFNVDFYENSNMPKKYSSLLTIIKDKKEVLKKLISVNDPISYEGITFYQSSYGFSKNIEGELILKIRTKSGVSETKRVKLNETFAVQGTDIQGKFAYFSPALAFDEQGKPFTFAEQMISPAVYIEFSERGKFKYAGWLMKRHPETWNLPEGHIIEFVDYWGVEHTGLQVRRDPGVWLVYLGFFAMAFGLYAAFFMSHRKIWVRLTEEKNSTKISIAFNANKNREPFESKIDNIISRLSK